MHIMRVVLLYACAKTLEFKTFKIAEQQNSAAYKKTLSSCTTS